MWTVAAMMAIPSAMMAQYPQLTPEAKEYYQKMITSAREHADSAWAVAKPIVEKGSPRRPSLCALGVSS